MYPAAVQHYPSHYEHRHFSDFIGKIFLGFGPDLLFQDPVEAILHMLNILKWVKDCLIWDKECIIKQFFTFFRNATLQSLTEMKEKYQ